MPLPGSPDLHINAPLTNVSVAWLQSNDDFIASDIFPKVPVEKRSDLFWKYSKSDWQRTDVKKRAPGTESVGVGWNQTTDNYYCDVYAVHKDIEDQVRANADSNWNLDADSTRFLTNQLLLRRDLDWAAAFFKTGVWGTEYTGIGSGSPTSSQFLQWDLAASDPLMNQTDWATDFRLQNGMDFSFMVVGADVWKALKNHPAILDRIKYTQKGIVTKDLVASFFDVPKLKVAYASQSLGPQINDAVLQDAAADKAWIIDAKSILLGYAPSSPSLLTPSAGYTFTWKGYQGGNKEGLSMSQFRMQHLKSDRIEGEMTYDMKVVSPDCGVFLSNVVS
jgi:hypothetical protein